MDLLRIERIGCRLSLDTIVAPQSENSILNKSVVNLVIHFL